MTKNAVCGYEATKAGVNVLVLVIEQANPPVSTKTQIGEWGREEEVFECQGGAVKKMWVDESVWLTKEVDGGKTIEEGAPEVVELGVGATEAVIVVVGKAAAVLDVGERQ